MRHVVLAILLSHFVAAADEPLVVPRPASPKWTEIKADSDGRAWIDVGEKAAEWELIDRAGAYLDVPPGSKYAVFAATKPGAYRIVAVSDGKLVRVIVQVGDVPPPPKPGPPDPPGPKPVDELTKKLQAAYSADLGATKAADLRQLISLYLSAAESARSPKLATAAKLYDAVMETAAEFLPDDKVTGRRLAGIRKLVAADLNAVMEAVDPDAPISDEVRTALAAAFTKYATALKGVTP